jgi:hypothetical protein
MKIWPFACIIVAIVVAVAVASSLLPPVPSRGALDTVAVEAANLPTAHDLPTPHANLEADFSAFPVAATAVMPAAVTPSKDVARLADATPLSEVTGSINTASPNDASAPTPDLSYLAYYAYSEVPPAEKPADTVLAALANVPIGTPVEEIKRAADAFGLDFGFMKAVAKIESGFDPTQHTGSYIGLFQLSHYEFGRYGDGEITSPRDNAIAAAYKILTEAALFELNTHHKPTLSDLYLIHQQGTQGAAEHVSHPDRIAWQSMCATEEGREKGEKWCKRAIWQNTLPAVKQIWKSVDKLTSGAFVAMWQQRVALFYARYSETAPQQPAP